jgi:hypothetical protein
MRVWAIAVLLPGLALADGARTVIPITQTVLPDNDIRYAVPINIGGVALNALLDTGSTGLRVLSPALPATAYSDTGQPSVYAYGAGDRFSGTIATANVTIGGAGADMTFQLVQSIGCMAFAPDCGAANLAIANYGIGGDGLANQGFPAILGASLAPGDAANPLSALGASRWIIELPEPGQSGPGALILNPNAADLAGFQNFALTPVPATPQSGPNFWQDALPGCLNDQSAGATICGPTVLDTGSPGIVAYRPGSLSAPLWSPDDAASLAFTASGSASAATIAFRADNFPGSGMIEAPASGEAAALVAGVLPFFADDVLYDADAGTIGLRPRPDAPDFLAIQPGADSGNEIAVIQMNTPTAPHPQPGALPQVITP